MDPRLVNLYPGQQSDTMLQQLYKTGRNPAQEKQYQQLLREAGIPFTVQDGKTIVSGYGAGGNEAMNYLGTSVAPGGVAGGGGGTSGGGGGAYPEFSFDWAAAENEALTKLEPYYKAKLDEAQGDVNRAKRLLEEDYQRGKRYREEDLQTQTAEEKLRQTEETRNLIGELNRRGVLFGEMPLGTSQTRAPYSDYAKTTAIEPMEQRQMARKQAIQRALSRQEEIATTERKRGIEEQDIYYPRYQREVTEEKKRRAVLEMAPLKYQQERGKYEILLNKYLQGRQ